MRLQLCKSGRAVKGCVPRRHTWEGLGPFWAVSGPLWSIAGLEDIKFVGSEQPHLHPMESSGRV